MDEGEDRPRPEAVSLALSALSCPMRAQVLPRQRTAPGQGGGDRFAYKRTIYRDPADLMMRHWVAEAAPELDHLHADAAWGGATSSRKYSARNDGAATLGVRSPSVMATAPSSQPPAGGSS